MQWRFVALIVCALALEFIAEGVPAQSLEHQPPVLLAQEIDQGDPATNPPPFPSPGLPPSPPIGPVSVEPGVNRPGGDYETFALPDEDPRRCSSACETDHRCAAYTFVRPGFQGPGAKCSLKGSVPQPVQDPCCVSGKR